MNLKTVFAAFVPAFVLCFPSCQRAEMDYILPDKEEVGVYATVPVPVSCDPETKGISIDADNNAVFKWIKDVDNINVFSSKKGESMIYSIKEVSSENPTHCSFLVEDFALKTGNTYYGFYPSTNSNDPSNVIIDYTTQRQYALDDDSHLSAYSYMVSAPVEASESGAGFAFSHKSGWITFNILAKDDFTAEKVVVMSTDDAEKAFITKGTMDVKTGAITPTKSASQVVLYLGEPEEGLDIKGGVPTRAFMALNESFGLSGFKAVLSGRNEDGETIEIVKEYKKNVFFEEGKYYTITLQQEGAVAKQAKIGDTYYETLADALAAVPTDGAETTIVLLQDVALEGNAGVTVSAGQNVVLDLNGKTLSNLVNENKASQVIANKGTLAVKNGIIKNDVAEGTSAGEWWGTTQYNYATNVITNTGILVIDGAEIYETAAGSICYAIDNNSSAADAICTIESGYVHKDSGTAIRMFCNSTAKKNDITVNGGTIDGGYSAIWVQLPGSSQQTKLASLTVNGGELKGSYAFYDYSYGDLFDNVNYYLNGGKFAGEVFSYGANITISGGTFAGDVGVKQTQPSDVSVSGGKFGGDVYCYGDNASTGFITGGLFSIRTYEYEGETYECDWCNSLAAGLACVENTDSATSAEYPWTVGEATAVAKIGDVEYETLAEAVAAAKSGDEIVLCQNVENVGKTYLPAGVTLNGNGYAVSGDSSIEINAEGGAVTNVKFQNIHNADNKLSAVYASNLTGSASVTNCTFDNCDWDAIQMVPQAGATIIIEGNTFSDDTTDGVQQQRFVHVQSAKNVDFSATITENIMTGDTRQGALECYYFTDDAKIILNNNYIEDMADVCVLKASGAFASDMVFPAYVDAEKSATYSPAAMIQTSAYSALFFDTLAEAAAAVTASSNTVKLLADCQNTSKVTFKNNVVIEGDGKTITGSPIAFEGESTTIKNVVFNNGTSGTESAAYFTAGNVKIITIDGCTFNDAKWDALQITSNTLQNVSITNCVFSNQSTGHRYIHIQPSVVLPNVMLTITGNTFNNITKDYVDDSAVTIYRLMLSNMTIENNTTTGAGAGVLTTDEFWINNGADASDLMSQAAVCKAFGGETPQITPDVIVGTQDELNTEVVKAAKGTRIGISAAGTYKVPALANNVTIVGITDGVVFDCVGSGSIASISNGCTFENVSFNMGTNDYHGFQHAGKITMNGCTINGKFFSYGDMIFDGCTFNQTASDYSMWCYSGNVSYIGCTINCNGKFANVYNEGNGTWTVEAENCIFNSTKANKAALNIKESCVNGSELHFNVVVKNCKATGLWPEPAASDDGTSTLYVGSPIWQVDDRTPSTIANSKNGVGVKVTVDDSVVYGK